MDSLRVSELAREIGMTSKDVIEKFAEIDIAVKSHSNTVTPAQIRKLKEHLGLLPKKDSSKPKAFIVKKSKAPNEEKSESIVEKKEISKPATPKIERIERVQNTPKIEKIEKSSKVENKTENAPLIKKAEKPQVRIERTKIEYKSPSRIEIVRKAPQKTDNRPQSTNGGEKSERKPFNKGGDKKIIERRIIPQEIYEGKGGSSSKRRNESKKKDKDYNSKKEDQEMISLEKAAAQKHKKKSHKEETVEEVKSLVVNQAMTIQELADKIQKTPAEIVKFLMFQGIMATVNQLIDVETIKKVCAEYELEVLEEDFDAFIEEEMEKEQKQKALTEVDKKLLKKTCTGCFNYGSR